MPGDVAALVPAAGRGTRLGAGPKALVPLHGEPLLRHAVRRLFESGYVERVVVAIGAGDRQLAEKCTADLGRSVRLVTGGIDRAESVRAALAAADDAELVLVHDAARCLVPSSVIRSVVQALYSGHPAVVPVVPVADTVKQIDINGMVSGTPDRSGLRAAQTPQGFTIGLLRRAYRQLATATDDAGLVEALGEPVVTVPGHPHAFKITTSLDLMLAEALVAKTCTP